MMGILIRKMLERELQGLEEKSKTEKLEIKNESAWVPHLCYSLNVQWKTTEATAVSNSRSDWHCHNTNQSNFPHRTHSWHHTVSDANMAVHQVQIVNSFNWKKDEESGSKWGELISGIPGWFRRNSQSEETTAVQWLKYKYNNSSEIIQMENTE